MTNVRLRVNSQVCGWEPGDIVTVVRSRMVDGLIRNQYVTVLDDNVPDDDVPDETPPEVSALASLLDPVESPGVPRLPDRITVPPHMVSSLLTPAVRPALDTEDRTVHAELSVHAAVVPPRTGKGSGAAVWRDFLRGQNVELTDRVGGLDNATKGELIDLWDAEASRRFGFLGQAQE